jgi:hypothetical protein
MVKSIDCQMSPSAYHPLNTGARQTVGASLVVDCEANWTFGPSSDREPGNACMGIVIGCVLSAPIWIAAAFCYRLLF